MVHKDYVKSVMECEPVSSRIIRIKINVSPRNLSFIQVYDPTSDSNDDEIDLFYSELETIMKNIADKDILVIQGDWKSKIGTVAHEDWAGTAGKYVLGSTNENMKKDFDYWNLQDCTTW